jgi:hypothetical protein
MVRRAEAVYGVVVSRDQLARFGPLFAALFPPAGVVICAMLGATHPWRAFGTILSAAGWLAVYETLLLRHFA